MRHFALFSMTLSVFCLLAGPALAGVGTVSSPYVTQGQWDIENNGTYGIDHDDAEDEWEHEFEVEYGLTDRIQLSAEAEIKDEAGEDMEFEKIGLGTKIVITKKDEFIVDSAVKLGYDIGTTAGKADKVSAKLNLGKKFSGDWETRVNFKLSREVGEDRAKDLALDTAAALYKKHGDYKYGVEYFGDFGEFNDGVTYDEQDHNIGPVVSKKWTLPNSETRLYTRFGYFTGISRAAKDSTVKYEIEFKF